MKFKKMPMRNITIELTPLVDVIFLLLIFFILVSKGIDTKNMEDEARRYQKIDLPEDRTGKEDKKRRKDKKNEIIIEIKDNSSVYINAEKISGSDLKDIKAKIIKKLNILKQKIKADKSMVIIRADKNSSTGNFVDILDATKIAKFKYVKLQTIKENEKEKKKK